MSENADPHPEAPCAGRRRGRWIRALRPRFTSALALALALAVTAAGFALVRQNEQHSEERLLRSDATQLTALFESTFEQITAVLGAAAAVAEATDGDPAAFENVIEGRAPKFFSSVSLVRVDGGRQTIEARVGPREPLLLSGLDAHDRADLVNVSRVGGFMVVEIATVGSLRVIGVAAGPVPGRVVYGEITVPDLQGTRGSSSGITYAVYYGSRETAQALVATTASSLPITGRRVTETVQLGGEQAVVVVGTRRGLIGGLVGAAPELVLALGTFVAVGLAGGLETRRRRAEARAAAEALERQNEALHEVDRMKDQFLAMVSHELRTPLTSILGYTELLREDEQLTSEQHDLLDVLDRNAHRLLDLVGQLLLLAQAEAGALSLDIGPVELHGLLEECLEGERRRAGERDVGLELEVEDGEAPVVEGDHAGLLQVFTNLLSNAVKFTPPGGTITVSLRLGSGTAVVQVADTGVGIPAEELERLFDRFYRASTARTTQGIGLGLAITKAIVEAHGGTIAAASAEGVGSTFTVELPLARTGTELAARAAALVA